MSSPRPISTDEWRQLESLVDTLLDTPPERRAALFAEVSGGDESRRAELERLVAECERAHPLLDQPAAERFAALVDDHAVRASEVLADRYRITREIGRGGMATVYLARDLRHSRDVAVKVVRAELAPALGGGRFLREIGIVAALRHPHIVPLYDSGETDGVLYYVMPYEAGHSLRERLARDRPLPIDEAVLILRDVCDALAHAHRHGIIHRDIKPDNVLLAGRHAMVTDFGVAKAISDAGAGHPERGSRRDVLHTTAGVSLGTPAYMAPEQVAADPRIDHRADIYAFGALAYELLAGRPPFQGEEPQLVLAAHLTETPAPVTVHRSDVPPDLARLVMKCLEKRPADRWQSTDEVLAHLERVLAATAGSTEAAAGNGRVAGRGLPRRPILVSTRWRRVAAIGVPMVALAVLLPFAVDRARDRAEPAPSLDPERIVVVPFRVSGVDPSVRDLAESVVDLLSAKLNGEGGPVAVDSRTAISVWNRVASDGEGTSLDAQRVARELGAGEALSGTIVGPGNRLTLTAHVIPADGGPVHPGITVTGHIDSLSALLDVVAAQLVARRAGVNEATLGTLTPSMPALRAYLWGRAEYRRGRENEAVSHFARAVELDSTFALAALYVALASGQPLGLRARCPLASCVTTYFALGFRNPGAESEHRRIRDALDVAWRRRDRLSPQDRALAEALRGDGTTERNTARVMIDAVQRAATAGPARAETQYILGSLLLYQGPAVEIVDSRARAAAAFRSALATDPEYTLPLAGLVEIAAFENDTTALRRATAQYLARDSVGPTAAYIRWRRAAGLADTAALALLRARFDSLDTSTLQRIVQASLMSGVQLDDGERAVALVVDRTSDQVERRIALGWAFMLALNRGRPRDAAVLLRRRSLEQFDALSTWTWATMAALFWDGDNALADSTMRLRAALIARDTLRPLQDTSAQHLLLSRHLHQQGLWYVMRGDTARATQAVRWLRRQGSDQQLGADFVDVLMAARARRPDAATLLARIDSVTLEGCCSSTIVLWANIVVGLAHEAAGHDADALRAMRRGVWRFSPQLLSTFLREEGRLAAKLGDRAGAVRAYRHYLALRSAPDPELRPQTDSVRAELARLEQITGVRLH